MKKLFRMFGVLGLTFFIVSPAYTEEHRTDDKVNTVNPTNLTLQDKLTGDWGGNRSKLAKDGVTVNLSYTAFYQDMFSGTGDYEFEFGNRFDAFINLDFGKLGLWEGGGFNTHVEGNAGNLPGSRGGVLIPNNTIMFLPIGETEKVVASSLYFTQKLSNSASLMLGKINVVDLLANDPFFGGWGNIRFMHGAFVAPLSGVLPPTIMGGILNYQVNPVTWTFMVYDPHDHTTDYSFNNLFSDGVILSAAGTWSGEWAGRTSSINVNGVYSTQNKANLEDYLLPSDLKTNTEDGTWFFSVKFSHLLVESPSVEGEGLGVYAKAGISNGKVNPFQSFITGGLAVHNMVPNRPNDVFGVGYFYYNFSDELQDATAPLVNFDNEQGMEIFYNFAVTPWFKVTADLQWTDPARGENKQIWLGGLRASVTF